MKLADTTTKREAIAIVDTREFMRFFVTGVIATIGNLCAVWFASQYLPYQYALFAGVAAGASISFPLTKIFAFKSQDWGDSRREMVRFVLIYGVGVVVYWTVSMVAGLRVLPAFMPAHPAQLLGALIGAGMTTVTNYLGHRFYTYRGAAPRG
ncbi:MAG: GtrA family protein [Janthinobacterium lividum]